ncbi:hypothetical protein [Caballeronia mineralivorans]|jgi:hypothetical protein|uniref:hypothetical protein n=1 Tax=Caballeronia mineralivorans TaxID=2010198 RepID=UPI002AFE9FCF|nr:hypothetical protein [Caballeronia mineralivorans]MEA3095980.1 hypothetical protein [Caballeronia mineralivorans]
MALLTDTTDVFSASSASDRCVVLFVAKRMPQASGSVNSRHLKSVVAVLDELGTQGWHLSLREMIEPSTKTGPMVFNTGFAHDADYVGVFEAPSVSTALDGTVRLEQAGWSRRYSTQWLLGPREFAAVNGQGPSIEREWGFIALWEWNDAWAAASAEQRRAYDAECDVAFQGDLALNVNIAGRHRLDFASAWHHLGIWEADSPETVDTAMRGHEDAADFMYTTSRHYIGRRRPLAEMFEHASGEPL